MAASTERLKDTMVMPQRFSPELSAYLQVWFHHGKEPPVRKTIAYELETLGRRDQGTTSYVIDSLVESGALVETKEERKVRGIHRWIRELRVADENLAARLFRNLVDEDGVIR